MNATEFVLGVCLSLIGSVILTAVTDLLERRRKHRSDQPALLQSRHSSGGLNNLSQPSPVPPLPRHPEYETLPEGDGWLDVLLRRVAEVLYHWLFLVVLYAVIAGPALFYSIVRNETVYLDQAFRPIEQRSSTMREQPTSVSLDGLPSWLLPHEPVTPSNFRLWCIVFAVYVIGFFINLKLAQLLAKMLTEGTAVNLGGRMVKTSKVPPRLLNDFRLAVALAMLVSVGVISSYIYSGLNIPRGFVSLAPAIDAQIFTPVLTVALPLLSFVSFVVMGFAKIRRDYKEGKY